MEKQLNRFVSGISSVSFGHWFKGERWKRTWWEVIAWSFYRNSQALGLSVLCPALEQAASSRIGNPTADTLGRPRTVDHTNLWKC